MDELLTKRLKALEEENAALNESVAEKKKNVEELREFSLEYRPVFPKSAEALGEAGKFADALDEPKAKLAEAKKAIDDACADIDAIRALTAELRAGLIQIREFDRHALYDQALELIGLLNEKVKDERFQTLAFLAIAKEALAYDLCAVLVHKAEKNIADGELPLTKEELECLLNTSSELTNLMSPKTLKDAYIDHAEGLTYVYYYRSVDIVAPTMEMFRELEAAMQFLDSCGEGRSRLTKARANKLHNTYALVFNRLSKEYFENEPNYDKALEVFKGRGHLDASEIEHYAYQECADEKEFYFAFAKSNALKKDPNAFKDWVLVHGQKAATGDELSFLVLAHVISMPLLDAAKFNTALRAIVGFTFAQMLDFFAECVRLGIDTEKAALLFDALLEKKREGDLAAMAPSLNYLNFHIDSSLREPFDKLRRSLIRGTKAHKVKIKSSDENVHLVFGEEKGSYPMPVGKPLKDNNIKAWSMGQLFFYWVGMLFLPIAAAVAGWIVMRLVLKLGDDNYTLNLVYAAPIMLVTVFFMAIGLSWSTRDEWESARYRRVMIIAAILEAAVALVYFIMPDTVPFFKNVSLPLFASSLLTGILAMAVFHETKRSIRYLTFIPFVLVVIAACVFLVIGGVNGTIKF